MKEFISVVEARSIILERMAPLPAERVAFCIIQEEIVTTLKRTVSRSC